MYKFLDKSLIGQREKKMGTFDRSDQRNPSITLISLIIVILAVILDGISAAPTSLPANCK